MVHDTQVSQYIPPTLFHYASATAVFTTVAGAVANTVSVNRAVATEASVITIPVCVPSNSSASKGAYLKSIEIDYEVFTAAFTAVDALIHKVTRAVEGAAIAAPAAQAFTQSPATTETVKVDQHKLVLTITNPFWVDNDQYVLVQLTMDAAATTTAKFYGAVANFTERLG